MVVRVRLNKELKKLEIIDYIQDRSRRSPIWEHVGDIDSEEYRINLDRSNKEIISNINRDYMDEITKILLISRREIGLKNLLDS